MKTAQLLKRNVKDDFPIFKNHSDLVYLDSAATSQKPKQVIGAIKNFYEYENANIHRGIYTLSEIATEKYEESRKKISNFINASQEEIVFTRNTTESINLLSYTINEILPESKIKDEIVLSEMEHHSNLIPWQQFAKRHNFKLKFIPITKNYELDYELAKNLINDKTAIVSVTHISNVLGTVNDVKFLIKLAKEKKALTIIDAAQSVPHMKTDVKNLDCDFMVFSSHKIYGPLGIGILYGKKELLKKLPPFLFGGGMISSVSYQETNFAEPPKKFEAGTPNIEGAIVLAEAINYIEDLNIKNIENYEKSLLDYTLEKLKSIDDLIIYNPGKDKSISVISFNLKNIHPHDVASILNEENIAIRAGHHCCMPLMKKLGISGTCRISLSIYNTKEDIDKLINGLKKVQGVFK